MVESLSHVKYYHTANTVWDKVIMPQYYCALLYTCYFMASSLTDFLIMEIRAYAYVSCCTSCTTSFQ